MIRKVGRSYVLYPRHGGKRLGTHPTRAAAEAQERAIWASKRRRADAKPRGFGPPRPPRPRKSKYAVGAPVVAVISLFRTGVNVGAGEHGVIVEALHQRYLVEWKNGQRGWADEDVLEPSAGGARRRSVSSARPKAIAETRNSRGRYTRRGR